MRAVRKPLGRDHKNASLLRLFSHAGLSLLRRPFGLLLPRGGALRQHSFAMFGAGPIRQRHLGVADPPRSSFQNYMLRQPPMCCKSLQRRFVANSLLSAAAHLRKRRKGPTSPPTIQVGFIPGYVGQKPE